MEGLVSSQRYVPFKIRKVYKDRGKWLASSPQRLAFGISGGKNSPKKIYLDIFISLSGFLLSSVELYS